MKDRGMELKSNCAECMGLCCIGLYFSKLDGFPEDKPAGIPCTHLVKDFHCDQHTLLWKRDWKGCLGYDCLGAGQRTTKLFHPITWQNAPKQKEQIWNVFHHLFALHQTLTYVNEAMTKTTDEGLKVQFQSLMQENQTLSTIEKVLYFDMDAYQTYANTLLKQVLARIHKQYPNAKKMAPSLFGKSFCNQHFIGDDFTMCCMIQADLSSSTFLATSFLGADLRDANIANADLSKAYFLNQMQINSAHGNDYTKLPLHIQRPAHWK